MKKLSRKNQIKELAQEMDVLDDMLTALVEILEEKGILAREEWENKIKSKVEKHSRLTSYRDIHFETT